MRLRILIVTDTCPDKWIEDNLNKETIQKIDSSPNYCVITTDYITFYLYRNIPPVMAAVRFDKIYLEKKVSRNVLCGLIEPMASGPTIIHNYQLIDKNVKE